MQMRIARCCLSLLALLLLLPVGGLAAAPQLAPTSGQPLLFVENTGQFAGPVRFQLALRGATLFLAEDGLWLVAGEATEAEKSLVNKPFSTSASWVSSSDCARSRSRASKAMCARLLISTRMQVGFPESSQPLSSTRSAKAFSATPKKTSAATLGLSVWVRKLSGR